MPVLEEGTPVCIHVTDVKRDVERFEPLEIFTYLQGVCGTIERVHDDATLLHYNTFGGSQPIEGETVRAMGIKLDENASWNGLAADDRANLVRLAFCIPERFLFLKGSTEIAHNTTQARMGYNCEMCLQNWPDWAFSKTQLKQVHKNFAAKCTTCISFQVDQPQGNLDFPIKQVNIDACFCIYR